MSFPWHNGSWTEAGEFLATAVHAGDRILAPDAFWWVLSRVERYVPDNLTTHAEYDWVVLDTNDMPQIPRAFLEHVAATMALVFVNDTFVVWSADATTAPIPDADSRQRLRGFWTLLSRLGTEPTEPNRYVLDAALADAPRLMRFADLSDAEVRSQMDDFFRRGGYLYPTLRDEGYFDDLRTHVAGFVDRCRGGTVLDLCSGGLPFGDTPHGNRVVRIDFSEVSVGLVRRTDESRQGIAHAVMDAQRIAARDGSFDAVAFVDSIEHVRDASLVLRETARVLTPGGWLLVTFANTNSLHQVIADKLGFPRFLTNHQHIREFSIHEIRALLGDAGFEIRETAGVSLYPYWGVPRLDEIVRHITDNDPEVVEMLRELGRRAGAEYAYTGVVYAQRSG